MYKGGNGDLGRGDQGMVTGFRKSPEASSWVGWVRILVRDPDWSMHLPCDPEIHQGPGF